jgi:hypothetical protein
MPHVMALRSRKPSKKTVAIKEEDAALVSAEERMLEDEEIASVDELGNPIVDMSKLEERNLAVAMTRSVSDMTGGEHAGLDDDDDSGGHRRYGLRTRRKSSPPVSPRSTGSASLRRRPDASSEPRPGIIKETPAGTILGECSIPTTITPSQPIASPPPLEAVPLVKPKPLTAPPLNLPPRLPVFENPPLIPAQTIRTSHGVPNPLASIPPPRKQEPHIAPVPLSIHEVNDSLSTSFRPTVPCPLPAVPCPLAAPIPPVPDVVVAPPLPEPPTIEFSSTDLLPCRRGRIFSMDIDPAGFDFPDMSVDIAASDFGHSPGLPPLGGTHPHQNHSSADHHSQPHAHSGGPGAAGPIPMAAPSAVFAGRDRAMSFEFFSLGINADEPLPPVSEDGCMFQRPRGDSIIFDPVSFQDGGIHEEKALYRSRACSVDLPSKDEMAIMNAPGFIAPPITHSTTASTSKSEPSSFRPPSTPPQEPPSPTMSAQVATLPSSLNATMNHATFQMDLLNKDGRIGIYLPDARRARIAKFHSKRKMRIWRKRIKYDCRKKLADSRPRIKGRFVKRSDMDED